MSQKTPPSNGKILEFKRPEATGFRSLGLSQRALRLGIPERQLTGHWCSRCAGIWFGYLLEVECPICGSRDG